MSRLFKVTFVVPEHKLETLVSLLIGEVKGFSVTEHEPGGSTKSPVIRTPSSLVNNRPTKEELLRRPASRMMYDYICSAGKAISITDIKRYMVEKSNCSPNSNGPLISEMYYAGLIDRVHSNGSYHYFKKKGSEQAV